jgi:tRNA threonylcarbamoyladenosine biosynthesis protein TsaB
MLLAIDTSTRYAGIALADESRVVYVRAWYSVVNHSRELMPAVGQALKERDVAVSQLDAVAVALGPGGFSALRVGLSAAKGLALIGGLPIVGVGTLDLEAFPYRGTGLEVCALLDAGRGEVASALFGPDGKRIRDDMISAPENILDDVKEPTVFCGEGVRSREEVIKDRLGDKALLMVEPSPATRLGSLAVLARRRLDAGDLDDLGGLQPYYLRMPSIGVRKQRDRTPQGSSRPKSNSSV